MTTTTTIAERFRDAILRGLCAAYAYYANRGDEPEWDVSPPERAYDGHHDGHRHVRKCTHERCDALLDVLDRVFSHIYSKPNWYDP